jgi:hypothetical protein
MLLCSLAIVVCAEKNNDRELDQRITQNRKTINERQNKQRWLWNAAKIVGPLGLMALGAYQWYKSSPINIEQQTITLPPVPLITQEAPSITQEIPLLTSVEPKKQLATPEDVAKYFKASKAYGASAVYFSILALFDPFFYPYVAATYMGSLYYGLKGVQPRLYPVSLQEIIITPPDLPY